MEHISELNLLWPQGPQTAKGKYMLSLRPPHTARKYFQRTEETWPPTWTIQNQYLTTVARRTSKEVQHATSSLEEADSDVNCECWETCKMYIVIRASLASNEVHAARSRLMLDDVRPTCQIAQRKDQSIWSKAVLANGHPMRPHEDEGLRG